MVLLGPEEYTEEINERIRQAELSVWEQYSFIGALAEQVGNYLLTWFTEGSTFVGAGSRLLVPKRIFS